MPPNAESFDADAAEAVDAAEETEEVVAIDAAAEAEVVVAIESVGAAGAACLLLNK